MGSHAGHYESSLMLRIRPELVEAGQLAAGFIGEPADAGARLRAGGMHNLSANGVIGDPRTATAAFGDSYFEAMVDAMVEHFSETAPQAEGSRA
jgi:creatinine amidohydrolase